MIQNNGMIQYEIAKQQLNLEKGYDDEKLKEVLLDIVDDLKAGCHLLYSKEMGDFTLMVKARGKKAEAFEILRDCIKNRGKLLKVERAAPEVYEIWIRMNDLGEQFPNTMYVLCPADEIIERW